MSGKYITDLQVSLNENEESQLRAQGFKKIDVDLNEGTWGKHTYLWYKKGDSGPITRIQFSFTEVMTMGLNNAGYLKINKNLNAGAGGDDIYLWFSRGSSEYHVPIVDLHVSITDDAMRFRFGWERLACNLNRKVGAYPIFLWVKRENPTYICDLDATFCYQDDDYFNNGYIRVDEDTNRGAGGASIFIWYRQTTKPEGAIRDLQVSINDDEAKEFQNQGYCRVKIDLNEVTDGNRVFLWYKKDSSRDPIKDLTLVVTRADADKYKHVDAEVIDKNLNEGNSRAPELYLCYLR